MRKDINDIDIIRAIASGQFICQEKEQEMFEELKKGEQSFLYDSVKIGLESLGFELKQDHPFKPSYFYGSSETRRLNMKNDLGALRKDVNQIIKNRALSFTGFLELLNRAYGHDIAIEVGQEFDVGRVQSALNNQSNVELNNLFLNVSKTNFFKSCLKKRLTNKERFDEMVHLMKNDGLIKDDGTGNNFSFTGKFIFQVDLIIKARQSISYIEPQSNESEQIHLI